MRGADVDDRQVVINIVVNLVYYDAYFFPHVANKLTTIHVLCQLRDDLMTMLIAGHETTAAVLTWSVFLLAQVYKSFLYHAQFTSYGLLVGLGITVCMYQSYSNMVQNPSKMRKAHAEVDSVLSNETINVDQLKKLEYVTFHSAIPVN